MKLYLRGKYYYFKPCINGKQKWVNTHIEKGNKVKARLFAEDWLHEHKYSPKKTVSGQYDIEFLLWEDFCKLYMEWASSVKKDTEEYNEAKKILSDNHLSNLEFVRLALNLLKNGKISKES